MKACRCLASFLPVSVFIIPCNQKHTYKYERKEKKSKVYAGRRGSWEALDRPMASRPLEGVQFQGRGGGKGQVGRFLRLLLFLKQPRTSMMQCGQHGSGLTLAKESVFCACRQVSRASERLSVRRLQHGRFSNQQSLCPSPYRVFMQ